MTKLSWTLIALIPFAFACGGQPTEEAAESEDFLTSAFECPAACDIVAGDANSDGSATMADVSVIYRWLFSGGRQPCLAAADANQDGNVDISDGILISSFVNGNGGVLQGPECDLCPADCSTIVSGDVNADGQLDISDFISLVGWMWNGEPEHICEIAADVNGDGQVDIADQQALPAYLFQGIGQLADPICE